jgi:hypothetical protein
MLKGDLSTFNRLRKRLTDPAVPVTLATEVATAVAPTITTSATTAYDRARTVYGDSRPLSVDGKPLSLVKTGDARSEIRFLNFGRILKASFGYTRAYGPFLVGKYRILPNGPIPLAWRAQIGVVAQERAAAYFGKDTIDK